jgi:hypothetical protein
MARTRSRFDVEDAAPRSDVYTGLLGISLVAMIVSCLLLFLDYSQYGSTKAPSVSMPAPKVRENVQTGRLPPLLLPPPGPISERPFTKAPDATVSTKPVKPVGGEEAQAPPSPAPLPTPEPVAPPKLEPPQPVEPAPMPAAGPILAPPAAESAGKPAVPAPQPPPPPLPKSIRNLPN